MQTVRHTIFHNTGSDHDRQDNTPKNDPKPTAKHPKSYLTDNQSKNIFHTQQTKTQIFIYLIVI